jgi:hypothetical protein
MSMIAVGDQVRLRYAPVGDSGTVLNLSRGRVQVRWNDLQLTTRHSLEALLPEPACTTLTCRAKGGNT